MECVKLMLDDWNDVDDVDDVDDVEDVEDVEDVKESSFGYPLLLSNHILASAIEEKLLFSPTGFGT